MTETSTTPTPPTSCPDWCTADHAGEPAGLETIHSGHVTAAAITVRTGGHDAHINVFLHGGVLDPSENRISVVHSGAGIGSGAALMTPREAPAVANLLRALGHGALADALDRAVTALGGES